MHRLRLAGLVGSALLALAACGDDATTTSADESGDVRTVEVDMVDNAFEPEVLEVARGETVRFVFTNRGELAHDAFIGDSDAQAVHETEMRDGEAGAGHGAHGDSEGIDALTVEPGGTEELVYTFEESGMIEVGCHQPGHYDAGMKITVEVT